MQDSRSQAGSAGATGLETRIERIRQGMAAQQARLARGSMMTASIGAILCALMAFWFYYGYVKIQEVMQPKILVQAAESTLMDSLPAYRADLEGQIKGSAGEWAAQLSKQVQENVPEVRQQLEELIVTKSSEAIDHFQVLSANQFRSFVTTNQPMLADGFRSLKKPEEADRFVQDLHSAIELQIGADMQAQADDMLHTLIDLNAKLAELSKGERMNHEQALEREILMIARRLQLETHADQPDTGDPADKPAARRRARTPASATAAVGTPTDSTASTEPTTKEAGASEGSAKKD